jgi:hypothetical protein
LAGSSSGSQAGFGQPNLNFEKKYLNFLKIPIEKIFSVYKLILSFKIIF